MNQLEQHAVGIAVDDAGDRRVGVIADSHFVVRRRFLIAMDEKARRYGERYPLDEEFLAAMAKMPEASGVALGFDRLVMLASGAARIDQVVWTPPAGEG